MEFAKSKAGHDKGEIYIIIRYEHDMVYLVNGQQRTIEKPKKKKYKHIQVIRVLSKEIQDQLPDYISDNGTIKHLLKTYRKSKNSGKEALNGKDRCN